MVFCCEGMFWVGGFGFTSRDGVPSPPMSFVTSCGSIMKFSSCCAGLGCFKHKQTNLIELKLLTASFPRKLWRWNLPAGGAPKI